MWELYCKDLNWSKYIASVVDKGHFISMRVRHNDPWLD